MPWHMSVNIDVKSCDVASIPLILIFLKISKHAGRYGQSNYLTDNHWVKQTAQLSFCQHKLLWILCTNLKKLCNSCSCLLSAHNSGSWRCSPSHYCLQSLQWAVSPTISTQASEGILLLVVQPREYYDQCKRDKAVIGVNTVVGYPPEKVAATILGIQEPSVAMSLSQGEFLSTETIS